MTNDELELAACTPRPVNPAGFNNSAELPYGLTTAHLQLAMSEFVGFLGFINTQLHTRGIERLETMLMPANFSSIVGEFMSSRIPRYCTYLIRNRYHNGHPDLIPVGLYPDNAALHADEGIEIKASRYLRGWQGHNPEDTWLMVFVFDSNRPVDVVKQRSLYPFRFLRVVGARLTLGDWMFSGRSATSRRTITASVTDAGYRKMIANSIYEDLPL